MNAAKNETCVQCEASPKKDSAEIISLTVSLTGKFDDVYSSLPYRYYQAAKVNSIYPRYGPKDGDTVVQVWGENFLDLGDDFRCNFGSRSTKAYFINDNYIWCRAAPSDVVSRPMPFSVSLNRQQNSLSQISYWYYNDPQIMTVTPDYGPMGGGTKVTLKGSDFLPFNWKQDINNQNDTFCNWGILGKTPAMVLSTTEAECLSPENSMILPSVPLNLTLNNQNYTNLGANFLYYNPPKVMEADPLKGPILGGTEVNIWGTAYQKDRKISCFFDKKEVTAKFISKSHLICTSPQVSDPGDVQLMVKYKDDRFESDILTYTYFANPVVSPQPLEPACGPTEGYTQITVKGQNFVEFGFGAAKCIFNGTYFTNATVLHKNAIVCDSPPLETLNGDMWYNVSVTLDGEFITNATGIFSYYFQPTIASIAPALGPLTGGTSTKIIGSGFNQSNVCDLKVRFGQGHVTPTHVQKKSLLAESPAVQVPGQVVVSISGNNQQFSKDKTLHFRDLENTFEYHQKFVIENVRPAFISNSGNSPLRMKGMLFDQFKHDNGTQKNIVLKCRFIDSTTGGLISEPRNMTRISDNEQECRAPKTDSVGDVKVEISANGQQWQSVEHSVKFYNGPRVTSVNPTYGVTKNPKNLNLEVVGDNFQCPSNDCSKIKVRFTNNQGNRIFVDGKMTDSGTVICQIPKYPAPETLDVDVSFNDQDYTNNGVKFGFLDPYIEAIQPRLISTKGTSKLTIFGYGFVQMEDTKSVVVLKNQDTAMDCQGSVCSKIYAVKDEHTATVDTFEQSLVTKKGGQNIGFDAFTINMMNPDGDFAKNNIFLHYYREPVLANISSQFAYANEEKPILIGTDFFWGAGNDYETIRKNSNFKCRFTSANDPTKVLITEAVMEASPIGQFKKERLPDQVRCLTPKWQAVDQAVLDFSINGQDYLGNFAFNFVDNLEIYKISPLSGPIGGETRVKVIGTGFTSSNPKDAPLYIKFGTASSVKLDKADVTDYSWNSDEYYDDLNIPKPLLRQTELNDKVIADGQALKKYTAAISPDVHRIYNYDSPDTENFGGPVFVQVGERIPIKITEHNPSLGGYKSPKMDDIEVAYPDSSALEFYFYREPMVKKIEPSSGLTSGGTNLELTGAWFDLKPEYGVFPFCKIGNNVIRAKYITSNRIICKTPASEDIGSPSPIAVSLNGQDFHDTGFTFSYYQKPVVVDLQPRSGSIEGGTEIWLKGEKFSNITHGMKTVRCRFRQIPGENATFDEDSAPTKFIPAYFIDNTTMKCASPSGWIGGDQVKVDLTFNGVDYTDNSFVFSFYNIFGSFPKSGPADSYNQYIQVRGKGFRPESTILCVLNDVQVAPLSIHSSVIKCPMVLENWPSDRFDSVPFHILIDGGRHEFGNFHYYKQITIESVTPTIGPQEGRGAVYFEGRDFRDDFENAKLGCRIGNTLGTAVLIDSQTIRCQVSNRLPLVDQGQSLLVSIALNSYSWAESDFSFTPYGISSLSPASGPISENTNILVSGKGFENELKNEARCKFGTDQDYVIVEAQVLDNEHLICKSPSEAITLPERADEVISVPFSIAFQEDIYYPFTEGPQKFRLYKHPTLVDIQPSSSQIGHLTEVYLMADENEGFWQPIPTEAGLQDDQYSIKCKFGRFGTTSATYINRTTVLCLTPNIQDDPADISEETVQVTVAMNGIDFNEEYSEVEYAFIGTGGNVSVWIIIMATFIFGLLIVSILIFLGGVQEVMRLASRDQLQQRQSNVQLDQRGAPGPRVQSRSGSRHLNSAGLGGQGRHSAAYNPDSRMRGLSRGMYGNENRDLLQ